MAKKKKYYVIWRGHETGIYESWQACKNLIEGYPNAVYKSFPDKTSAEYAFYGNPDDFLGKPAQKHTTPAEKARYGEPVKNSMAVDAACSGNPGVMEYQGVMVDSGKQIFHQGPFPEATVNIGEFLALVHGLAYMKQKGLHMPIYSDSMTAISWVKKKKANTKLPESKINHHVFDMIRRAELWLQQNTWKNKILKWETSVWGEIPADFGRK
ncbi:MAG: viroplasmin family protein [Bacteroidales bacterium]